MRPERNLASLVDVWHLANDQELLVDDLDVIAVRTKPLEVLVTREQFP